MEYLPQIVIGILLLILFALVVKLYFLHKSAQEITEAFQERLTTDTNTLISISTRDPHMRRLATQINTQLRLLRQERHRYQQGDLELKEAVTNISHDLRTPLTAIRGYLNLLEGEELSPSAERYFAQIENRTEALTALTEELFRYSLVSSEEELVPEKVDLVGALEESLLSFFGVMEQRGIQPEIHLPEGPMYRQLDRSALSRVFANIISNALKYTDGDFAVSMDGNGNMNFSNRAKKLDPVAVGRLFDRFYTLESSRNSTGLGLSIAKLLTEKMGGTIGASWENQILRICLRF